QGSGLWWGVTRETLGPALCYLVRRAPRLVRRRDRMSKLLQQQPDNAPQYEAVVIGAGPAGLAAAAMLDKRGVEALVLERSGDVGASWRSHYDRLHLHTIRWLSGLPGKPISRSEGAWVAREGVVRYLEDYARTFGLNVRTGISVHRVEREGDGWLIAT